LEDGNAIWICPQDIDWERDFAEQVLAILARAGISNAWAL
jgi:hypothetical protein